MWECPAVTFLACQTEIRELKVTKHRRYGRPAQQHEHQKIVQIAVLNYNVYMYCKMLYVSLQLVISDHWRAIRNKEMPVSA